MHALCCRFPGSAAASSSSSFAATATRRQVAIVKRLRESATGFGLWTALRYVNPVLTAVALGCFQKCFVYVFLFAIAKSECQRQKGMAHRKYNKTQKQIERNLETFAEEEHSHKESPKYFRLTYTHTYTQTQAQRCTCAGPCCCYCCCCCCGPFCTRASFK